MTALIMKDIATLKKTLFLTFIICAVLAVYGIYENEILMIPLISSMMPLILNAINFGYDNKSKFEQFAFSMPIKKSCYVISKLFFAFAFGLFGAVCMFVLVIVRKETAAATGVIFLIPLATLVASVLISAIQLPFILKYGAEKGRLIMLITYFVIFTLSTLLKENSNVLTKLFGFLGGHSLSEICSGAFLVSLAIIFIAIKVSIAIMEKKEY